MNTRAIALIATLLPGLSQLQAQSTNGQAERVLQSVPIGYIIGSQSRPTSPVLGSFLMSTDRERTSGLLTWQNRLPSADGLIELVRSIGGAAFDEDGAYLEAQANSLMISAAPDAVRQARRNLAYAGEIIARPIRIRVSLYRTSGSVDLPATVSAAALPTVAREAELLWSGSSVTRSGRKVALGRERHTPFIGDVDVEVAQKAKIGDPVVYTLFEGVRVAVEPHSLVSGDELVLLCQYAIGDRRGEIPSRSTGVDNLPSLDAPSLDTVSGSMSARLANGGAMLLCAGGTSEGGSSLVLMVSASFDTQSPAADPDFALVPISALSTESLSARVLAYDQHGRGGDIPPRPDSPFPLGVEERERSTMSADQIVDLSQQILSTRMDEDLASVDVMAGYLVVRGNADDQGRISAMLKQQEDLWLRSVRVRAITGQVAAPSTGITFPVRTSTDQASENLHSISFPALLDRPHFAMRGVETTSIRDYDVEIAQKAQQANPVIEKVFSGILCSVMPRRWGEGLGAELDLNLIDSGGIFRRPLEADYGGDLYLTRPASANFLHDGPVPSSGRIDLGDGPIIRTRTSNWQTRQYVEIGGR